MPKRLYYILAVSSDCKLLPYNDLRRFAGVAQLVEHQPSKLNVAGSNPVARFPRRAGRDGGRWRGRRRSGNAPVWCRHATRCPSPSTICCERPGLTEIPARRRRGKKNPAQPPPAPAKAPPTPAGETPRPPPARALPCPRSSVPPGRPASPPIPARRDCRRKASYSACSDAAQAANSRALDSALMPGLLAKPTRLETATYSAG
jgi:hypothetical protein